jgi:DNA-binding LacI/PurR family transcriptional regulator
VAIGIREVAARSGVSTATVSYVLNNREGAVGAETRERVLRAMRELGYRPSAVFRGEQARRTNTIGVIFAHVKRTSLVGHPYFAYVLDGILSATTERGLHTTLFTVAEWQDVQKSLRTYCDGRCDGLILIAPHSQSEIVTVLKERGTPFALVNAGAGDPGVACADVDNVAAAEEATRYLLARGHRRIAHLAGNDDNDNGRERITGYQRAMEGAGIAVPPEWLPAGYFGLQSGYERTWELLRLPDDARPTAVFCGNDQIAEGVYRACAEAGARIPHDLSVIGFDDEPAAATLAPPLTTLRQPLQTLGERAALNLFAVIAGEPGAKEILPAKLVERGSVAEKKPEGKKPVARSQ